MKKPIKEELKKKDFRVTIFGSARIKKNSAEYKQVYILGKLIGERGIDIVTGGGPGVMEAANKGHKKGSKGKAHSIGLVIKLPKEQGANKYVGIQKEFPTFSKRLDNFMLLSNVMVIMPGGIGTLLEALYTWQLMQVNQICHVPIIFMGKMWPELIKWIEKYMLKNKLIDKKDLELIFLAKNCNETMKMVDTAHEEYKKGTKNYCLNYKKYKLY